MAIPTGSRLRVVGELPAGYAARIRTAWPESTPCGPGEPADAVLAWDYGAGAAEVSGAGRPRWVHLRAAGVTPGLLELARQGTVVTTGSGGHGVAVAEHVLALVLAHYRRIAELISARAAGRWPDPFPVAELHGRTAVVLGTGDVGRCTARLLSAFGVTVAGVSRGAAAVPGFDRVHPVGELPKVLPEADLLIVAVPLTPATRGLIGAGELAALPPHALLVNVARGAVVDEPAMISALRDGRLAGAGLDVVTEEPLPAGSPLWSLPTVLLSPHCADTTAATDRRCLEVFLANVRLVRAGRPPARTVRPDLGY